MGVADSHPPEVRAHTEARAAELRELMMSDTVYHQWPGTCWTQGAGSQFQLSGDPPTPSKATQRMRRQEVGLLKDTEARRRIPGQGMDRTLEMP